MISKHSEFLTAAKVHVGYTAPFFSMLAHHSKIYWTDKVATAATDGSSVMLNPEFMYGEHVKTDMQRMGVLFHEVLHMAFRHVDRRGARNPELWNIAADIVINEIILKAGWHLPEGIVTDPKLAKFSVEEVYDLLSEQQEKPQLPKYLQDLIEGQMFTPGEDGGGDGKGNLTPVSGAQAEAAAAERESKWAEVVKTAQSMGNSPLGDSRELGHVAEQQIPWRAILWRYMTADRSDYGGFDVRRCWAGQYIETLESDRLNVHVCIDTSGSIHGALLDSFIAELRGVLNAYPQTEVYLWYCDAQLYGPHTVTARGDVPAAQGGGGTDFRPFFDEIERDEREAHLAIYMTDGLGVFPACAPKMDTLWVVTPGGAPDTEFKFGNVVRITKD